MTTLHDRVILCGKVKLACFDKTGTLTEDSLDVLGVQSVSRRGYGVGVAYSAIYNCVIVLLL